MLPHWRGRRIGSIAKAEVIALLDAIAAGAPVAANRTKAFLSAFFNFALQRDLITVNPCAGVRAPTVETSRDRVLDDSEIASIWSACDALNFANDWNGETVRRGYGDAIKLLLLTGSRREEISALRWSEVDLEARTIRLPRERTKNGRPHEIPLSPAALAILQEQPRAGEYVFGGDGRPPSGWSGAKARLDATLPELEHWVVHDLRRSCASGLAALGVAPHVIEAALNHASGQVRGVAAIYNRYDHGKEKRAALDLWASHLEQITGANVHLLEAAE